MGGEHQQKRKGGEAAFLFQSQCEGRVLAAGRHSIINFSSWLTSKGLGLFLPALATPHPTQKHTLPLVEGLENFHKKYRDEN